MKIQFGKYIWIALVCEYLLISGIGMFAQTAVADRIAVCGNYLHIRGESNINEFSFYYNSLPDNLIRSDAAGDTLVISIPIRDFEASNSMMYKDFLELMKEDMYPRIYVTFLRKQLESAIRSKSEPCPEILITIAGVTRRYTVECMVEKCSGNYYLKGKEIVKLSDFKLKPPARLFGLVKVNNEIDVNFGFIITFTASSKLSSIL